ncbi:MAG: (d)CMP kinase [Muribaculaceae bacterium]|nr:(d)CMP kinase [Muribaculaceae bacterium]MDE6754234.1 (d)CMP kinase [Muribaculaceae bacterium]
MGKKIIVAIDGFSSSGKSTMARELAKRVGYVYVDSGAMYRAVTLYAMRNGMVNTDGSIDEEKLVAALPEINITFQPAGADGVQHTLLNGEDVEKEIRSMEVSSLVSPVAVIPAVRERLVALQQGFGKEKGIVMDGRDIGTTVFPDAEMKVFVSASPEERARRRFLELKEKGVDAVYEEVLRNVEERDHIDTTREVSPLRKAADAIELDNGSLTPEQQMNWLMDKFQSIEKENI